MLSTLRSRLTSKTGPGDRSDDVERKKDHAAAAKQWKETAGRFHRRILSGDVLHQALATRASTLRARASIPGPAEREATLRSVSPAYVNALTSGPATLGNHVHRMTVDGLNWWMPIVRPTPEGPTEDWLRKQRFSYGALTQTRELAVGGIMLDLGANTGRMSIPRVVLGDVVAAYCAEPDPLNYACLVGNMADNGLNGLLLPDHVAVSDRDGTVTLSRGKYSGGHRVLTENSAAVQTRWEQVEVPCVTVDSWLHRLNVDPDAVTFVKVDVQGFEMRVLQGASGLLARRYVVWQLEVDPQLLTFAGSSLGELCEKLKQHFTRFIDLNGELTGPRACPIAEITDALGYLGANEDSKTDVLVF